MKSSAIACRLPSALACLAAAGLALAALSGTGCEGTSSGVDNPGVGDLTVDFRGEAGAFVPVTGDLDVYGKDQNPALYPEPLATVRIRNSPRTRLTSEDFRRINMAVKAGAATKRSASGPGAAPADTPVAFNLVFRSDARTGSLAFGLVYDPVSRSFSRGGSHLAHLEIVPRGLIHYEARIQRLDSVHGDLGRVFIPGTPFQATLSDSGFAFAALPPGVFDLRLMGGDGRIFAVRESLDTRTPRVFTPDTVALGRIDTTDTLNKPASFTVSAASPTAAFVGMATTLDAKINGADPADKRLGILWRVLRDLSADTAEIMVPHSLNTQVTFRRSGSYTVELAATLGASVARDTLVVTVQDVPVPEKPKLIFPSAGDTVLTGMVFKVAWDMPLAGRVSIQLSTTAGREGWQVLADTLVPAPGVATYYWTPAEYLAGTHLNSIRIRHSGPDTLTALLTGTFSIMAPAPPAK